MFNDCEFYADLREGRTVQVNLTGETTMSDTPTIIEGDLAMAEHCYVDGDLIVHGNIRCESGLDITVNGDISVKNIFAKNINAKDITVTWNIFTGGDIIAKDITVTGDIAAENIITENELDSERKT
jgi:cytoskeletal protein CcmA (bactofilin family)